MSQGAPVCCCLTIIKSSTLLVHHYQHKKRRRRRAYRLATDASNSTKEEIKNELLPTMIVKSKLLINQASESDENDEKLS